MRQVPPRTRFRLSAAGRRTRQVQKSTAQRTAPEPEPEIHPIPDEAAETPAEVAADEVPETSADSDVETGSSEPPTEAPGPLESSWTLLESSIDTSSVSAAVNAPSYISITGSYSEEVETSPEPSPTEPTSRQDVPDNTNRADPDFTFVQDDFADTNKGGYLQIKPAIVAVEGAFGSKIWCRLPQYDTAWRGDGKKRD